VGFYIVIVHDRKRIRLKVEKIEEINGFEKFRVSARNKTFIFQTNRPLLLSKGLKHRKVDWKITEGGSLHNSSITASITNAIETNLIKP
jgi:hypothetical protein